MTKKQNYELQIQSQQAYYETASNGRKRDEKTKLRITNTVATGLTRNSLEMAEKVTKKQNYKLQIQSQQAKLETASIWQKR